ncbi:MAG: hypothetical protein ABSA44_14600 [Bacteroidota bacterium]|jgi:hypothetical protein
MKKTLPIIASLIVLGSTAIFGQGKFSGYMFGDYYYNVGRDSSFNHTAPSNSASSSSAPGAKAMQAFQFRRIYLAYDNDISEQFTTRFRLEADQGALASSTGDVLSSGKVSVFVKDAYLRWKNIFSGSDAIFGVQPTPAYDVSEAAWGYRSLEKTIMDLRGIVDSRDMGLSLKGKITGDGMLNYWLMLGNGAGTAKPETDRYKRYYAHIQLKPTTNLQATLYIDYKDVPNIAAGNNSTTTTALFVGYAEPFMYNIGVEGFMTSQSNAFTPTGGSLGSKDGLGVSVFGSVNLIPELAAVVRYDYYDPNTNSATNAKGDVRNYVIAGLSWKVDKNVSIMPNLLYETYEAPVGKGEPDPSITARLTLYYVFL